MKRWIFELSAIDCGLSIFTSVSILNSFNWLSLCCTQAMWLRVLSCLLWSRSVTLIHNKAYPWIVPRIEALRDSEMPDWVCVQPAPQDFGDELSSWGWAHNLWNKGIRMKDRGWQWRLLSLGFLHWYNIDLPGQMQLQLRKCFCHFGT